MSGSRNKPLNIALLRRRLDPSKGGAEKVAHRFVREFLRRGHRITFYGEEVAPESQEGIEWIRISRSGIASSPTTRFNRNVQAQLKTRRHCYDIVYSMCRTFPVDVFRVTEQLHIEWLPLNYPFPIQVMPRHRSILKLERKTLSPENVRHVVTNSSLIRDQVIRNYDFPPERITRIPNGVDREIFRPPAPGEKKLLRRKLGWPENRQLLLFIANDFRTKRLDLAIRALAGLGEQPLRDIQLVVAGGDEPAPFRAMAGRYGVDIRFIGRSTAMRDLYAAADLLYFPTPYEPFANVCLEAAACALPVLTTRLNGASELISSPDAGYVVERLDDVAAIRQAVNDFISRPPELRETMGENILKATAGYTWESHADMLEQLFRQLRCSR